MSSAKNRIVARLVVRRPGQWRSDWMLKPQMSSIATCRSVCDSTHPSQALQLTDNCAYGILETDSNVRWDEVKHPCPSHVSGFGHGVGELMPTPVGRWALSAGNSTEYQDNQLLGGEMRKPLSF